MSNGPVILVLLAVVAGIFITVKLFSAINRKIEKRAKHLSEQMFSAKFCEFEAKLKSREKSSQDKIERSYQDLLSKQKESIEKIEDHKQKVLAETAQQNYLLNASVARFNAMQTEFENSYISGRKWLASFIAEADKAADDTLVSCLKHKRNPALKAAEEVSAAKAEKRQYKERLKYLEYQLKSYIEYFPFLEEYEDVILDEAVPLTGNSYIDEFIRLDPVLRYVPKAEYEVLSPTERNQKALDRYLSGVLSRAEVGRLYERYIGYIQEKSGWKVEYHGIFKGLEDLGRDLICSKDNEVQIIQAKCWSSDKVIHEKHIFQLFGTTQLYIMNLPKDERMSKKVSAVFATTTTLSPMATQAAEWLNIEVREKLTMDKTYPIIKCNVNQTTKEKIYHLPFDQQYDRTQINTSLGESYAATCAAAEKMGFRRAMKYSG